MFCRATSSQFLIQLVVMRNPAQKSRLSSPKFWPFQPPRGHVFFLGLLLVAALPAAILTCAILLPMKLVQWLKR